MRINDLGAYPDFPPHAYPNIFTGLPLTVAAHGP